MEAWTLSDENIGRLMADPPLVWLVVSADDPDPYLREVAPPARQGWLARLLGREVPPAPPIALPRLATTNAELRSVYLDKSWDGIHHCLERLVAPGRCKDLFNDGAEVGELEIYCGPAMALTGADVADIARCYRDLRAADLLAVLDSGALDKAYLSGLWSRNDDDARSYLVEHFEDLKAFVAQAAADKVGILVVYT